MADNFNQQEYIQKLIDGGVDPDKAKEIASRTAYHQTKSAKAGLRPVGKAITLPGIPEPEAPALPDTTNANQNTTEANDAVRTIRNVKSQLGARQKEAGTRGAELEKLARPFVTELSAVESEIYQVKNESSQDPLNFPIRLNNKIAALAGVVGSVEAKPTRQSVEVFRILSDSLAMQTGRLRKALDSGLPPINREIEKLGLKAIVPSAEEIR